ncbi:MAG: YcaO-related McrA-glycine thioamidation protein [Candidatus Methanomethylophilaceae archaeon]|jgi:ribosomal protein S12 methylthiotransferase accessory factor|nr:YcaO-related McrA-glycine thioamidation protein [Candidatus Methanomethylophilaceae archaeon]NLF34252.1 YcaO-related McrA-glycine thioamidation protein [Thermoplasmatales archaeon]
MILNRCPKYAPGAGIRTVSPEETLKNALPVLERIGADPPEDVTGMDCIGIPVFSVCREMTAKGLPGNYNGKGATREQAMASAVMETIERYSSEMREDDRIVYGTYRQAAENGPAIDPVDLILPVTTLGILEGAQIAWTAGYDLFRGTETWVPACEVFYPYRPDGDLQLYGFHTNGIAAGNTLEEAILHGLFELIERDAWSLAEERGSARADIETDSDSLPGRLLKCFADRGVIIRLKDMTSDIGVPTVGASADETATEDPEMLTIGVGTHLNPEIAAVRAITEVAQSRVAHKHGLRTNARLQKTVRDMGYKRMKETNRLWYGECSSRVRLADIPDRSTPYVLDDIEEVLGSLAEAGLDSVVATDLTRPETGIPAVRMTIPGLEVATMDPSRRGYRIQGMRPRSL